MKTWPLVRALRLEIKGSRAYPNAGPGDPSGTGRVLGNQDENDAALRRAAHKELDRLLDAMLPAMPLAPRWISWSRPRASKNASPAWEAHLVAERHGVRTIATACGLTRRPPTGEAAHFAVEPFNDAIKCATCVSIAKRLRR